MNSLDAYHKYAKNPNIKNAKQLLDKILSATDLFTIDRLRYNSFAESLILSTNGSTNAGRNLYGFGPYAKFWICEIERYLKGNLIAHTIQLDILHYYNGSKKAAVPCLTSTPDYALSQSTLAIDLKDHVNFSESILQAYSKYGKINLLTVPNIAFYLLTDKNYKALIDYHRVHINSIITINTDPFYPYHELMRDQMINWQTGLNYYICQYRNTHVLPLFTIDLRNALNAYAQKVPSPPLCDDLMLLNKKETCRCGKMAYDLKYVPHIHNQIKKDGLIIRPFKIANELSSCYYSLQFEQNNNDITIHYVTKDNNSKDLEYMNEYFRQYKLNVILSNNTIFKVGQKQPAFWNGKNIIVSDVNPHV